MKHFYFIVILILLVGCSRNPDGLIPVNGVVYLDSEPAVDVSVIFSPRGAEGNACGGSTDAAGRFSITTGGAPVGSGALAGEYDVLLSKVELEEISFEEGLRSNRQPKATYLVPQKYGDAKTSGIEPVTVEKGGKNAFTFKLQTKQNRKRGSVHWLTAVFRVALPISPTFRRWRCLPRQPVGLSEPDNVDRQNVVHA